MAIANTTTSLSVNDAQIWSGPMPDQSITPVTIVFRAMMATSIPFESDSLSLLMREPNPYPIIVDCLVTVRNSPVSGFMDMIFISLHILVNLLLRGVTFFFFPMVMDVVNAGHLICLEADNVTIGILHVVQEVGLTLDSKPYLELSRRDLQAVEDLNAYLPVDRVGVIVSAKILRHVLSTAPVGNGVSPRQYLIHTHRRFGEGAPDI
ncbi:hypothetical protein EDC04DRAFT_2608931 [Pisolithus marmoratus]|nr:hypothetical protein EDC04DRAFT_2608931 [Pisolithus marmoratus]